MKRITILFFVAVATLVVLLFFTNPGLLDNLWLWIIGFIGYIIALVNTGVEKLNSLFKKEGVQHPSLETGTVPRTESNTQPSRDEIAHLKNRIRVLENQLEAVKKHQIQ